MVGGVGGAGVFGEVGAGFRGLALGSGGVCCEGSSRCEE